MSGSSFDSIAEIAAEHRLTVESLTEALEVFVARISRSFVRTRRPVSLRWGRQVRRCIRGWRSSMRMTA